VGKTAANGGDKRKATTADSPQQKNETVGAKKPTQQPQASFCGFFARLING